MTIASRFLHCFRLFFKYFILHANSEQQSMSDGRRQRIVTLCAIQRSEPNNTKAPASPKQIGRVVCDVSKLR